MCYLSFHNDPEIKKAHLATIIADLLQESAIKENEGVILEDKWIEQRKNLQSSHGFPAGFCVIWEKIFRENTYSSNLTPAKAYFQFIKEIPEGVNLSNVVDRVMLFILIKVQPLATFGEDHKKINELIEYFSYRVGEKEPLNRHQKRYHSKPYEKRNALSMIKEKLLNETRQSFRSDNSVDQEIKQFISCAQYMITALNKRDSYLEKEQELRSKAWNINSGQEMAKILQWYYTIRLRELGSTEEITKTLYENLLESIKKETKNDDENLQILL